MQVIHQLETYTWQQEPVYRFRITNTLGAYVELTNWGARWIAAVVPDAKNGLSNVIQGYETLNEYLTDPYYMGAIVGRFANRIANASFSIDGTAYQLEANDGENTNHGGTSGFHQKLWQWQLLHDGVCFTLHSPDGEGGYPGNLRVAVEYRWNEQNELSICYHGLTDKSTYLNMTNHAYFNLSEAGETIANHSLTLLSNQIVDTTANFIPTGKIVNVTGTPFDFTSPKEIGQDIGANHPQLRWNKGFNHCYVLKEQVSCKLLPAAHLYEPFSKRSLTVETNQPGVLIYTSGYLPRPHSAVCIETQFFPDTPSHTHFPSCLLRPQELYHQLTTYKFKISKN